MITVYSPDITDYTTNGLGILHPTSCVVTEKAGANYSLSMQHPIDPQGRWKWLQTGFIIKVPVPAMRIESTISGENVDIYKANSGSTPVRSKPSVPTRIYYDYWVSGTPYYVGNKVAYKDKNYQLTQELSGVEKYQYPSAVSKWAEIPTYTTGGAVLVKLKANEEFYKISDHNTYWLYVQTAGGVQGYVQKSAVTYVRTTQTEDIQPREIHDQLFRIYNIKLDSNKHTLTVTANHVSYDFNGSLLDTCVLSEVTPATALSRIKESMFMPSDTTLATNLGEEDGTYTGTLTYENLVHCLLDPDIGIVPTFKARLIRDNWDFFIFKNTDVDRGFALRYGVNLKGVNWTRDTGDIVTRIMPVAKKADDTDLLLEGNWIESDIVESYPVINIEKLQINGKVGESDGKGGTWTTATLRAFMESEARKRFEVDHADGVKTQLKVDFQLLGDTEEYKQYKGLEKVFLYDTIKVSDPIIGLEQSLQVSQIEWDAVLQRYKSVTLGDIFDYSGGIAGYELANGSIKLNKLSPDTINKLKG